MFVGEWLNGRVAVSKTVGCVFESRLPCHKDLHFVGLFLCYHYEHATNTFVFMVASDAALSVQAPSLRYYSNRVSPAKRSI